MVNKRTCMRSRSSSGLSSQVPKNIYISLARRPLLMLAQLSTEFYIALLKKRSDLILQVNNYVKFFMLLYIVMLLSRSQGTMESIMSLATNNIIKACC